MDHVGNLAQETRFHSTTPSRRAQQYITRVLRSHGIEPIIQKIGTQKIPSISIPYVVEIPATSKDVDDANIVVKLGDQGPTRVFVAHYDTVHESPGAIDNAASVAILLEIAKRLKEQPPKNHRVEILFSAAEEVGLVGARHHAQKNAPPELAVSLDMVGYRGRINLNGAGKLIGLARSRWIKQRAIESQVAVNFAIPQRSLSKLLPMAERSDHGAFSERDVPAFHLYSEEPYLAYHSQWDTPDKVDLNGLESGFRFAFELARSPKVFPSTDSAASWIKIPFGPVVIAPEWLVSLVLLCSIVVALIILVRRRHGDSFRPLGVRNPILAIIAHVLASLSLIGLHFFAERLHAYPLPWMDHISASTLCAVGIYFVWTMVVGSMGWQASNRWCAWMSWLLFAAIAITLILLNLSELAIPFTVSLLSFCIACTAERSWVRLILFLPSTFSLLCFLSPGLISEMTFHQFFHQVPFGHATYFSLVFFPSMFILTTYFNWFRIYLAERSQGSQWALVGVVLVATTAILTIAPPKCSAADFFRFDSACTYKYVNR